MATIQQSIEIRVPVQAAYNQLMQFEDYPRFMEEVETVRQLDDTHLHWTTAMSTGTVEWDAEIIEQEPDRCIAWRNNGGPASAGRIEVQPAGPDISRVTFTLDAEPQQAADSPAGIGEQQMAQRLKQDLARLKDFMESRGSATGAWRGEIHDAAVNMRDRDAKGSDAADRTAGQESGPVAEPGIARGTGQTGNKAGREGIDEVAVLGTGQGTDRAAGTGQRGTQAPAQSAAVPDAPQVNQSTQSDYSLSRSADDDSGDDGRYSIAEEVNLDQQSDAVRHVGQMPQDRSEEHNGATSAPDGMAKAMQQDAGKTGDENPKPSMDRAVPPSKSK